MRIGDAEHRDDCVCFRCRCRRLESLWLKMPKTPPTQEADGHFRGCARLGKCRCPANAPRDEWRPDNAS